MKEPSPTRLPAACVISATLPRCSARRPGSSRSARPAVPGAAPSGSSCLLRRSPGKAWHEEACTVATAVLDATPALGSHIVVQQLRDLTRLLEPHRSAGPVGDFLARLDSDIRQRVWLFQQTGNDGQDLPAASGVPA